MNIQSHIHTYVIHAHLHTYIHTYIHHDVSCYEYIFTPSRHHDEGGGQVESSGASYRVWGDTRRTTG